MRNIYVSYSKSLDGVTRNAILEPSKDGTEKDIVMLNYVMAGVILALSPMLLLAIDPNYDSWWIKPSVVLGLVVLAIVAGVSVGRWWSTRRTQNQ